LNVQTTVLIPALNEGPRLALTLQGLASTLPEATVLVVDGGSTDDTVLVAQRYGAQVQRQEGRGYANALATGYRRLLGTGVQRILQLDADGQHPPKQAPRLLAALSGADWVFASRSRTDSPAPAGRRAGNHLLALAVRRVTGLQIDDVTSGYWAVGPRALAVLGRSFPAGYADANVRVLAWRTGLSIVEVPVSMPARLGGQSMHDGWRGVVNLAGSLQAVAREASAA
jgi:glycosyltransferase involved in cell wall biosynthesis